MLSNELKSKSIVLFYQFQTFCATWIMVPQKELSRLSETILASMRQAIKEDAQSTFAATRVRELEPIAKRCPSRSTRVAVKIVVVLLGAVTFSSGVRIYTATWGRVSLPVSLFGGLFASYFVDFLATRTLFGFRKKSSTEKCLENLHSRKQITIEAEEKANTNELVPVVHDTGIALCRKIEGSNLMRQFLLDALIGCSLSIIEFVVAFSMVRQVGIFEDFSVFLTGIASLLPVIITWAASAYQSASFDLPEYYADLIPQYEDYMVELYDPQLTDYWEKKSYECGRLDAKIQFVLDGDRSGKLKNVEMAGFDFDLRYYEEKVTQLEKERAQEISQRLEEFTNKCNNLEHEAMIAIPSGPQKNLSPQQVKEEQEKAEEKRRNWIKQEEEKLARRCQRELDLIDVRYQDEIQRQQRNLDRAEADYQAARENWKRENGEE